MKKASDQGSYSTNVLWHFLSLFYCVIRSNSFLFSHNLQKHIHSSFHLDAVCLTNTSPTFFCISKALTSLDIESIGVRWWESELWCTRDRLSNSAAFTHTERAAAAKTRNTAVSMNSLTLLSLFWCCFRAHLTHVNVRVANVLRISSTFVCVLRCGCVGVEEIRELLLLLL